LDVRSRPVSSEMRWQVSYSMIVLKNIDRDNFVEKDIFKPGKVQIIGISPDPVEKQKAFVEKEKLTVL
jgi:hypothetical protein